MRHARAPRQGTLATRAAAQAKREALLDCVSIPSSDSRRAFTRMRDERAFWEAVSTSQREEFAVFRSAKSSIYQQPALNSPAFANASNVEDGAPNEARSCASTF
jgi:hypothetical protein